MGRFPPKFVMKVGIKEVSVIRRGYLSENRAADPRPSASPVPPPGLIYRVSPNNCAPSVLESIWRVVANL